MDFTTILDYQKLEGAINQLQENFKKNPAYREYALATKAFNDVVASFKDLQAKLNQYALEYQKISSEYEKIAKELDEVIAKSKEAKEIEEITEYVNKLNTFSDKLEKLSKDCEKVSDQITKTRKVYDEVYKEGQAKQSEKNKVKDAYTEAKKEVDANVAKCTAYMNQIEGQLAPEAKGLYNKIKAANIKFPYFVEQTLGSEYCAGCRQFIGQYVGPLKKSGDYIECPECGRILFIK